MTPLFAIGLPSGSEWIWIALIALLVFGPKKLPELFRGLGRSVGEFKKAKEEFEREMHAASRETPAPSPTPTAQQPVPALLPPAAQSTAAEAVTPPVATPSPAPDTIPQTKIVS